MRTVIKGKALLVSDHGVMTVLGVITGVISAEIKSMEMKVDIRERIL